MKVPDQVRVIGLKDHRFNDGARSGKRCPKEGDRGTIVAVAAGPPLAFTVECADPADGTPLWLEILFPGELGLVDADTVITIGSDNIFVDLGFPPEEAAELLAHANAEIAAEKAARAAKARRSNPDRR